MKNGNFVLIAAMLSLYAFGDGRVTETSWHGAYDSGDYSDEGFVVKKTDSFDKKTYYWCCKDCGNGIEVIGFDVNENWDGSYVPCVYAGTWDGWPDGSLYVGYTYLHSGIIPLEVNGKPLVKIGIYAFVNCGFNSFDIPSTVTKIDSHAFQNCKKLLGLDLPSGLTEIGNEAFSGCVDLFDINIPVTVTKIGAHSFRGCEKLRSNGLIVIDECLVDAEGAKGDVVIPEGVRLIADGVFADCEGLTSVAIPRSVRSVGSSAFRGCISLRTITIPSSVTNIGNSAFYRCTSLQEIVIPTSVRELGREAFSNCDSLKKVTMPANMKCSSGWGAGAAMWFGNMDSYSGPTYTAPIEEVVIAEGTQCIESYMFDGCKTLKKVTLPAGLSEIYSGAFRNCSALACINIPDGVTSLSGSAFEGTALWTESPDGSVVIDGCLVGIKGMAMAELRISDDVRLVAGYVFGENTNLKTIIIPATVKTLSSGTFWNCSSIERIDFEGMPPAGIEKSSVPSGVCLRYNAAYADEWAPVVARCGLVNAVAYTPTKPDGGPYSEEIDGFTWTFCVQDGVAMIEALDDWGIPLSQCAVEPMPVGALTIPRILGGCPVVAVGDYALYGCGALTAVEIPTSVTYIGIRAFAGCSLSEATLPEAVLEVGCGAFASCPMKKLTIEGTSFPDLVEEGYVGGWSLRFGSGLSLVEWSDYSSGGYKVVLQTVFGTQEKTIWNYDSDEQIASLSWEGCDCAIIVGEDMEDWHDNVSPGVSRAYFYGYNKLRGVGIWQMADVYRMGWHIGTSQSDPEDHFICGHYPKLNGQAKIPASYLGVQINGLSAESGQKDCGFDKVNDLVVAAGIRYVGGELFTGSKMLTRVTLPDGFERIGPQAFMDCLLLNAINIPDTVSSIGSQAFEGCAALGGDPLVLDNCLVGIADKSVKEFFVPDGVRVVAQEAFAGCYSIKKVSFPSSVTRIPYDFFDGFKQSCRYVEEVTFRGDAPFVAPFAFNALPKTCVMRVMRGSSGWDVDIPGLWQGFSIDWIEDEGNLIPDIGADAEPASIEAALDGSADERLQGNITDATTYGAYREWALKIGATDVKASPFAWVSFATDSAALLAKMPTDDDLKVEEFKPSAAAGSFDFTVSVKDVTIGDKASVDNLKKLFGLEGAESLDSTAFSSENVSLDFREPQDGKLKFTATPAVDNAKSFFMKAKVK